MAVSLNRCEAVVDQVERTSRKRKRACEKEFADSGKMSVITHDFVKNAITDFKADPRKIMARNAIVNVGLLPLVTDSEEANKVSHIFMNTIKQEHVKATNQAQSGRCWMFAGLNTIRHILIADLKLKNFEFSETYLYFYDKIERSAWFLDQVIKMIDVPMDNHLPGNRSKYSDYLEQLFEKPIEDGGYWNYFANLVDKYGLVPKDAMGETVNSLYSESMNTELRIALQQAAFAIRSNKSNPEKIEEIKQKAIKRITDMMIIFMGVPPEKFNWSFTNMEHESACIKGLTPIGFKNLVFPKVNFSEDFIVLNNFPVKDWPLYRKYEVKEDNNMIGGNPNTFLNLPISELKKAAIKSIQGGLPVWFAGDVQKGFHPFKSVLDEKVFNYKVVFGEPLATISKGDRLLYKNSQSNHAMTLTGVNLDEKGNPINWQVENSWGFDDDEIPGEDGFLSMSDQWFTDNIFIIAVHKTMLTRSILKLLEQEPIPFSTMGSAAH